jgi:DNA-binding transcriptional regulator GbsR (MarR family)
MDDSNITTPFHQTIETVNTSIMEGMGQLFQLFWILQSDGAALRWMLLPEPLSLDDLMERLSISKASVSTHMRTLEQMGIVREAWVKDDRRKFYRAEGDFWRILTNILSNRELRDVNQALRVLVDNSDRLQKEFPNMDDGQKQLAEFYIERLDQLQDFFQLAQVMLDLDHPTCATQPDHF